MIIPVSIQSDEEGYVGRECPKCEKYFKVKSDTGAPTGPQCRCPYCNELKDANFFWTKEQIAYANSIALNQFASNFLKDLKKLEMKPDKNAFISIGITVTGQATPIAYYTERQLEEKVTCGQCALDYTIYGSFGYCPNCGVHNSLQIVNVNFDLALKILDLSASMDADVKSKLVENALEDTISAFDGFGRAHCADAFPKLSFQNIASARDKLLAEASFDLSAHLQPADWKFVCEQFQKRHLLAHKLGIIDSDFVQKTGSSITSIGKKVSITEPDVYALVQHMKIIANNLYQGVVRL